MSYEHNASKSTTFWQTQTDGIAEPAILIEWFSDCFAIVQDGNRINLNYESSKELVKILKQANDLRPS